jgi:hypothetical protein
VKEEEWRPIKGFEDSYQVSSFGRVRSLSRVIFYRDGRVHRKRGRVLSPSVNKKRRGYLYVGLGRHSQMSDRQVHRLVAQHFISNPENKPEVNHVDGIKAHCWVENLEWATKKENGEHAARNGLVGTRKISPVLAREIKIWVRQGRRKSTNEIADKFQVSLGVAAGILYDVTWRWL